MQIDATKDFKRSRAQVLQEFRSSAKFEKVLGGMGIQTTRTADAPAPAWNCVIDWRDEPRRFTARMVETTPDETMTLVLASALADASLQMDFYDLPDGGCRVIARVEPVAKTLMVRVAMQSMRLVRGKAENRLTQLITALGRP